MKLKKQKNQPTKPTDLASRIKSLRSEVEAFLDKKAEEMRKDGPSIPLPVLRQMLTARHPGNPFSAALAIYIIGGAGVVMNAIFDLEIALCLIIGIGIGELDENDDRSAPVEVRPRMAQNPSTARWGLLLVLVLGVYLPQRLLEVRELWKYGRAGESDPPSVG